VMQYWLLKTEPTTYSFENLKKDKKTNWNGIRNFQARNFLKQMEVGDTALIYHSGEQKSVVGVARVIKEAYLEVEDWVQVDLEYVEPLKKPVTLAQIKSCNELKNIHLVRQGRLSTMPLTKEQFKLIYQQSLLKN